MERKTTDEAGKAVYKSDSKIRSLVVRKGLDTAMLLQRTSSGSFASWGDDFEEPQNEWELLTVLCIVPDKLFM